MKHQHHTIDYIEFNVTDLNKAKEFYSKVFGWEFNDYAPTYAGIKKQGGGEVGGFSEASEVKAGGPLIVLYSNDLESSLASVKEYGGEVVKDIFEFPGGRRFEFKDPSGNMLAVWSE